MKFDSEDNGNCRVYYRDDKRNLYCFQNEGSGSRLDFKFYRCSQDGEPSHEVAPPSLDVPLANPAETAIGRELIEWRAKQSPTLKHTPGPWHYGQESVDPEWWIVTLPGGHIVANVNAHKCQEGNARLIAAAPELLAALVDLLGDSRNDEEGFCVHCGRDNNGYEAEPCSDDCPGEIARAAIAKATGDAAVTAADTLSHSALLDAAREGVALGEDDGQ